MDHRRSPPGALARFVNPLAICFPTALLLVLLLILVLLLNMFPPVLPLVLLVTMFSARSAQYEYCVIQGITFRGRQAAVLITDDTSQLIAAF